ncbi:hypothetical protein VTJ04DRAFT_5431 [Mycothermus thermophilus]|uniref:uncharacterized protein n=1 Tax=Humicola insolens TaxID=85995 RepID=UPI003742786E
MASRPVSTLGAVPVAGWEADAHRARLHQLAAEYVIHNPLAVEPLRLPPPRPQTPNDDLLAEDLLKHRRLKAVPDGQHHGRLIRAFSSNSKSWDPADIFHALEAHVESAGSPGVAQALISKLREAGGNLNYEVVKSKTPLLGRRRSLINDIPRSRILQKAIEKRHVEMVAVLIEHADNYAINEALPEALLSGDLAIVSLLLSRGVKFPENIRALEAFDNLCKNDNFADVVGLVLQSSFPPPPDWVSMGMVHAAEKGCVSTVLRLSRAGADGDYDGGKALKRAIDQGRVDIVLAILTGKRPPKPPQPPISDGQALMESFSLVLNHNNILPNVKLAITEALLCAGASGDLVSHALERACESGFYDMVSLLVSYGASIEYRDAALLRHAIVQRQAGLVELLLTEKAKLSPIYASECFSLIPEHILAEDRYTMFNLLLRKGAKGDPLNRGLIHAVRAGDVKSVELLVTPHFPGAQSVTNPNHRASTPGLVLVRHEIASVDYGEGLALQIAVHAGNVPIVKWLLAGKPSSETLDRVFPLVLAHTSAAKYEMVEAFLSAGLSHEAISATLHHAINQPSQSRDSQLIGMLLRHNADINFNDGAGILSAITIRDLGLLQTLLQISPSPETMAAAMDRAMQVEDHGVRYEMVKLLLGAGAGIHGTVTSQALVQVLWARPRDMNLATLLLEQGNVDANFDNGTPVALVMDDPDPRLLQLILQHGQPSQHTIYLGLQTLSSSLAMPARLSKAESLLSRCLDTECLVNILDKEVKTLLTSPRNQQSSNNLAANNPLAVLHKLLVAKTDVNVKNASAFCEAVKAADVQIVDLFLSPPPSAVRVSPFTLKLALPYALKIADPAERFAITRKLISAGAPRDEACRALKFALTAYPRQIELLSLLAEHGAEAFVNDNGSFGAEIILEAVKGGNPSAVEIVIANGRRRLTRSAVQGAFLEAMKTENRKNRVEICKVLLAPGVDKTVLSDSLLVAAREGDLELGKVLLEKGASVEHAGGQSIVEACGSGEEAVVKMLLTGAKDKIEQTTLDKAFNAAAKVVDLAKRAAVFRLLLEKGVSSEALGAQLVVAAKYGPAGEPLVRLLLAFGASADYNGGEAIWNATRGGALDSLKLMLGLDDQSEEDTTSKRPKLSQATLLRALKASRKLGRDDRYQVINWLFDAGLAPCEDIDIALQRAVKEEPDARLVRLLLDNGASPLTTGCKALVDAAQGVHTEILSLLLEKELSTKDISSAFQDAFTPETVETWLCDKGFEVVQMLLAKDVGGSSLSLALGAAIHFYGTEKDALARKFATALLKAGADVNGEDGYALQMAAYKADSELIGQILERKPNSHSLSMAFPYLFDADLTERETLTLMELFLDYSDGEERLDVMFRHPVAEPVMFRAVDKYPRSVSILQALLDAGYYHEIVTKAQVLENIEEPEEINLLMWMILQPQKRVSSDVIRLLINRGANVNFETAVSKTTPLMAAIRHRREDVVKMLLLAGAEADTVDVNGNTPMTLVTQIGGSTSLNMLASILVVNSSKNDGSLHNAARDLNIPAMDLLIQRGHHPDFPSTLHGGRSALGELCLNAAQSGPITPPLERKMEKAIEFLIQNKSDLSIRCHGKSVLHLALHSADPIPTTRALLKMGLWDHVNKPYNLFNDGKYTYSPTQYVARVLPCEDETVREKLISLLKDSRAEDVYYANEGPQPADAINVPDDLLRIERQRRAREELIAREDEDHALAIRRTKEFAAVNNQLFLERAELEDLRRRRLLDDDLAATRAKYEAEQAAFEAELRRRQAARELEYQHEQRLTEAGLTRTKLIAEAQLEQDVKRHEEQERWERRAAERREEEARALSDLRVKERHAIERIEAVADERTMKRIEQQTKLIEGQAVLAAQLAANGITGPQGRRQIGFVSGELD